MTPARLALASAITALLVVAGSTVAVRTPVAPGALAFIGGGRVAVAAPADSSVAVSLGARGLALSDPGSLDASLAAAGYKFPPGAGVYAAKVTKEAGGLAYDDYQGGVGAIGTDFWPASSIKVLAAVGALEFVGQQGFTGAATVTFPGASPRTIKSIYDSAIRVSSNDDYDLLVEIAGVDWLNEQFLSPSRGLPTTVIQRSYTVGGDLRTTPAMTLSEGAKTATVPARNGKTFSECPQGQCSNLYEMSESIRRVVFHNEIPASERFKLAPADVAGLTSALLGAEGFFEPSVARVIGPTARIYGKPGEVAGRDCLDVAMIDNGKGLRLLLSATMPEEQGGCPALVTLATAVLKFLTKG